MNEEEKVDVTITYLNLDNAPADGPGWYAWESEYPEEGYFWCGTERPTAEQLKAIHPAYVEKK